ncbi:arylamine N-acetyltransferase, pineal gland isozyme NAT-10-like [Paramormyrops kingsleyae]|uniref:arylamine N-acetyltransferase, pineal gland isozyme NAT-10-like n=1 Tax=Paramormyrops kingsleyae TaxID=1676925 RepID=UPI003B976C4B
MDRMNVADYLQRIGYKGPFQKADLETLNQIHKLHVDSIPFENLSIHCGEKITMDLAVIYDKIIRKNRGGWCCENNYLFSWVLKELGYNNTVLGSRVFNNFLNQYNPRESHFINKIDIDGVSYIADVSFGVSGQIWQPLELTVDKDQPQLPGVFRLIKADGMWVLQKTSRKQIIPNEAFAKSDLLNKSITKKIYGFTLAPRQPDHFMETIQFLQTSPESLFVQKSICSLQTPTGFHALIGWTYTEVTYNYEEGADLFNIENIPKEEVETVLKDKFNLLLEKRLVPLNNKAAYTL